MAELILAEVSSVKVPSATFGSIYDDGIQLYRSSDALAGVAMAGVQTIFKLTADGAAIGAGIADFFGASSSFPTETSGIYLLYYNLYFLKSTAGTIVWTITNTQQYTNIVAAWYQSVITGMEVTGATGTAAILGTTTAAAALPITGSCSDAKNHHTEILALAECDVAGNIRLRATESAGTITPRRGSYYTVTRIPAGNVGTFVA